MEGQNFKEGQMCWLVGFTSEGEYSREIFFSGGGAGVVLSL